MDAATISAISAAIVAVITAATVLVAALRKQTKAVEEVHTLVDGRMTETLRRVDQLTEKLESVGVAVPRVLAPVVVEIPTDIAEPPTTEPPPPTPPNI